MKTIAIVNLKGGVGKTVTAVNVAAILATEYGQRVLLIDADPQANATQSLLPPGEYNTLAGLLTIPDAYYDDLLYHSSIRGLDVLPADDELRNLDVDLLQGERPNLRAIRDLRDAVAEDDAYDCIVIDCPPALSPACAAAIAASTDVVIPIKVDAYSVRGMNELTAQIDRLRSIYPDVHVAGCLPTMWYRSDTVEQGERLLREQAPVHVFASHIRRSPKVDESTWTGEPVVSWSPRSAAAQDYRAFVTEFLGEGAAKYGILRSDAGGLSNQKRMVMFFCKQNRASLDLIRLGALRFTAARRRERHEWQWKRRDADRRVKLQHILPKMRQTRSSDRAWGTGR